MTTLVCWCGRDSRGPASLYIATDSRITWPGGSTWDSGRKLAVRAGRPEMLAFAGDVTLVQSILLALSEPEVTDASLRSRLEQLTAEYPWPQNLGGTAVVFARRVGSGMTGSFVVTAYEFRGPDWLQVQHPIPEGHSDIVCVYGSGATPALDEVRRWMEHDVSDRTSRSVFSGFCDALRRGKDPRTGGPPQLAGIYRSRPALEFGLIWNDGLFVAGTEPLATADLDSIEWRNDLFERCDPRTKARLIGAQRHARPYGLR